MGSLLQAGRNICESLFEGEFLVSTDYTIVSFLQMIE